MKLSAVTVCVNYSDFLAEAVFYNQSLFDRWVIVTTHEDHDTRNLCRKHGLECLNTDEMYRNPGEFNKARGIALGIDHLGMNQWILHIDSDIVLPRMSRQYLELAHLDPECVYGCDRGYIDSWEQWVKFKATGYLEHQHRYGFMIQFPSGLKIGNRFCSTRHGYVPIGFFQLWHTQATCFGGVQVRNYPFDHNSAARTDVQHSLFWERRRRLLLPELIAVHLDSEPAKMGANWKGRKTKRFGPEVDKTCVSYK